jgi:hypothetical protein
MIHAAQNANPKIATLKHALAILEAESQHAWNNSDRHEGRLLTITRISDPKLPDHQRTLYESDRDAPDTRTLRREYFQLRQYAMDITSAKHQLATAIEWLERNQ